MNPFPTQTQVSSSDGSWTLENSLHRRLHVETGSLKEEPLVPRWGESQQIPTPHSCLPVQHGGEWLWRGKWRFLPIHMVSMGKTPAPVWAEPGISPERAMVSCAANQARHSPAMSALEKLTTWVIIEAGGGKTS